jgi:hypothetical protein
MQSFTVPAVDVPELGAADANGFFQQRLKYWLKITKGARNNLQNLRGRGLLLKRLGEIVGALTKFLEEPRVLDGDYCLAGKSPQQLALLVR